jgi:hypothetical protein
MSETQKYGSYDPTKSNSRFKKRKNFYINAGSNVYRICPPFASLKEFNRYSQYHAVYWLTGTKGKRPAPSHDNKREKIVDPITAQVAQLNAEIKALKEAGDQKSLAVASAKEATVMANRVNKSFYLNAMDLNGNFGVLSLNTTLHKALDAKIKELFSSGFDPINLGEGKGLYLDFKQHPKGDDGKYSYEVAVYTRTVKDPATGRISSEWVDAPIAGDLVAKFEREASDLNDLFTMRTFEEQQLLASLDPTVVDRIFARPTSVATGTSTTVDSSEEEEEPAPAEMPTAVTAESVQKAAAQHVAPQTTASAPAHATTPTLAAQAQGPRSAIGARDIVERAKAFATGGAKANA